jgi:hypothetical protein
MVLDSHLRSSEPLKNSAFKRAVVVPAVFALVFSGSALIASPALADGGPSAASDAPSPVSDALAPTDVPATEAPAATPEATPTPAVTASPAPTPRGPAADSLVVTSPKLDAEGTATIHGKRVVTVAGSAPIGSKLVVSNSSGTVLATLTTETTAFSVDVAFTADDSRHQKLTVAGVSDSRALAEVAFDVVFDGEQSAAPAITSPVAGATFASAPMFGNSVQGGILQISGVGTAGDRVTLTSPIEGRYVIQTDDIVVGANGKWTGRAYLTYGTTNLTATQARYDADGSRATGESEQSTRVAVTIAAPKGTVVAPFITTPNDKYGSPTRFDDDPETGGDLDQAPVAGDSGIPLSGDEVQSRSARSAAALPPALRSLVEPQLGGELSKPRGQTGVSSAPKDDTAVAPHDPYAGLDGFITDFGIRVVGTPSKTSVGTVDMTVAGTGTPGDGIVLYQEAPKKTMSYLEGLYPRYFSDTFQTPVLNDGSPEAVAPAPGSTGDPNATEKLPAYDGTIRVGADGTWTTTISRAPGNYILEAFAVSPGASANPRYSVASVSRFIHLTGTPSVAVTELAFTGSQVPVAGILGAFGAVGLGAALTLITRRRRTI